MTQHFKLTILSSIFITGLLASNILGSKVIDVFGIIAVSVGIFAYPLTFLVTDAIGEVYGKQKAKQVVWAALIAQVLMLGLVSLSVALPPAARFTYNDAYIQVFGGSARMIFASLVAFLVSQMLDIKMFEFWRKKTHGRALWIRNNASTVVSQAVDTLLFLFLAFYHLTPKFTAGFILHLGVSYWLFKVLFALIDTPFVYAIVAWLKRPGTEERPDEAV